VEEKIILEKGVGDNT